MDVLRALKNPSSTVRYSVLMENNRRKVPTSPIVYGTTDATRRKILLENYIRHTRGLRVWNVEELFHLYIRRWHPVALIEGEGLLSIEGGFKE